MPGGLIVKKYKAQIFEHLLKDLITLYLRRKQPLHVFHDENRGLMHCKYAQVAATGNSWFVPHQALATSDEAMNHVSHADTTIARTAPDPAK